MVVSLHGATPPDSLSLRLEASGWALSNIAMEF